MSACLVARLLAGLAGVLAVGGCYLYTPVVRERPSIGEALRACEDLRASGRISSEDARTLRAVILSEGPRYNADAALGYGGKFEAIKQPEYLERQGPSLYATPSEERAWLDRARAAGVVSNDESARILASIDTQARRSVVRRSFTDALRVSPPTGLRGIALFLVPWSHLSIEPAARRTDDEIVIRLRAEELLRRGGVEAWMSDER